VFTKDRTTLHNALSLTAHRTTGYALPIIVGQQSISLTTSAIGVFVKHIEISVNFSKKCCYLWSKIIQIACEIKIITPLITITAAFLAFLASV